MTKKFYRKINPQKLTYRDALAVERTALANERTLLSYVRTMIAFIAIGGTLIKLFTEFYLVFTGLLMVIFGILTMIVGLVRYVKVYILINSVGETDLKDEFSEHNTLSIVLEKLHLPIKR